MPWIGPTPFSTASARPAAEKTNNASVPESLKVVLAASRVSPDEAEDAGGLTPGKDDNEVWRNPAPQIMP
ncbi:MAG: hypothetical protein IKS21_06970, partial [Oscillospiraceae bacterium]|nr:hypothetical protein [Oscillospiraceae bacterium]